MYNPQVPMNAQQMGQPMPQGGNMPVVPGQMAPGMMPGMMPPGSAMPPAQPAPGGQPPIDPAAIQAILAMNTQQGRRTGVDRQMALADQLRADAGDQLKGKRTGIANVGAAMLDSYAAKKQMEGAKAEGGKLDTEREGAASRMFDLIKGLRGAGSGERGGGMGFGGLM